MERVGIVFLDRPSVAEQIKFTQLAERKKFESVWICETRLVRDAISVLGALAVSTKKIKLGTGVINTWTRNAALTAMTFATLDEISKGRAILGLGAYWDPLAWKQGIERRKPLQAMREYIEVVRRLLKLETVNFDGEIVKARDLKLDLGYGIPKTPKKVPIYIGATGLKMMELAGENADGVLLIGFVSTDSTRNSG
jgi:5,10-methylenetetrahydromethanopterin reductase